MSQKTAKRVAAMIEDPELFLKHCVFTQDESDKKHFGAKQFPYKEKAYLKDAVKIWKEAEKRSLNIVIEKSRQMMVSWVYAALHLHEAFTVPNRKILLLSKSEEKAIELLNRLEYIYKNIPTEIWPENLRPKMIKTKTRMSFEGMESHIWSLTSSPDSARSITASRIFLDEFAFMPDVEEIYQGAVGSTAGGGLITMVSTNPVLKGANDCLFWRIRDDRLQGQITDIKPFDWFEFSAKKGLKAQINSNGFVSMALHYSADPTRDPANPIGKKWYDDQRRKYDKRRWDTEMEMSRATYGGHGVFSDDYNEDIHMIEGRIEPRKGLPILRGWDFAGNHSICFAQFVDGCAYVIDELPNIGWHTRDVVPKVLEYSAQKYPDFAFIDLPDPSAFDRGRNDVDGESNIDRMVSLGIDRRQIIKVSTNRQEPRLDAVMKLLTGLVKGQPKFKIAETCQMIRTGLKGAYQFKEKIQANQSRPSITKNEYSHIIDALQYVALFIGSGWTERYLKSKRVKKLSANKEKRQPVYKL
jgi:hypothetical protein